ncbi:acyl-CoA dehydrogenase [Comamonas serinivorans]|uniref:Acyl-CoA dehydrogenase n=2 Tax=Comamonas serinivorans TaxID=1082851 RepID=A0A1Y0ET45_9BURK|nr:acyl-CoA dehydrogenase [Comamonas serinivorans]
MLLDSARRYLDRSCSFEQRQASLNAAPGASAPDSLWPAFAEMGWLALGLPEAVGGLGSHGDQAALAQELGRALVPEPWLANTALCAPVLNAWAPDLAAELASGQTRFALAAWEIQGRHDAFDVQTQAGLQDGHWVLTGRKTLVLGADTAHTLLVLARTRGRQRDTEGLSLFRIAADAPGVHIAALPTYDGQRTASVRLNAVTADPGALLGPLHGAWPQVEAALDTATVMQCAMSVGTMDKAFELTQAYAVTRTQFGRPLSAHQVIRHRLVDLFVSVAQARALTEAAAAALTHDAPRRMRAASLAKAFVAQAGRKLGEEAVQMHGAIGMTDETEVGHAYKALAAQANLLGDAAWHLARLEQLDPLDSTHQPETPACDATTP